MSSYRPKNQGKYCKDICPESFYNFLGALCISFLVLPGDLVSNVIYKEALKKSQEASKKLQGSYKNFQGRNPYNIFVSILVETMAPKRHFEINQPLVVPLLGCSGCPNRPQLLLPRAGKCGQIAFSTNFALTFLIGLPRNYTVAFQLTM